MMVINSGDQFPEPAGVLLVRWLWRYRSELAPATLAACLMLAAIWSHAAIRQWWPIILSGFTIGGLVLAAFGAKIGIPALIERLYWATVTLAAGTWLALSTASGPFMAPLPLAMGIGTLVLAVPWWAHRRRRARVRVTRKLDAWPDIARAVGLAGSEIMSATVTVWGWRARIRLARGQTIADVTAKIPALESGLGTHRNALRVHPTPDDLANRCELRVLDRDPHADAITWPGPSVTSITEPVGLGPFEDAEPCRVLFLRRHAIFGGTTGAGKSGGLNVLMGNLTACRDAVVWAIDLKKGMELQPWASCIGRLATTPEEATVLLRDATAIMQARAAWLAAHGRRTWEPAPGMPALIILIDEYAELTEQAPGAMTYTDSVARLGRAVAVTLVAATQRPTQKAMGQGAVRSMMDLRICFRVRERRDVDLILGQGMLNSGWHAHKLNAPGKFLISAPEHDTPRRARAYLLTDQAVADTVARHAPGRPELDEISRQAIGQAYNPPEPKREVELSNRDADTSQGGTQTRDEDAKQEDPDVILWAALSLAPDEGISVPDLVTITRMGRRWIYYRLKTLAATGRVIQTACGRWRIATNGDRP